MKILRKVITISIVFLLSLFYANIVNAADTAKITADTVRIREKASTNSSILELISINEEVEVLEKEEDWYKIKYKDITGYVKADLVELNETEEKVEETTQEKQENTQNNSEVKDEQSTEISVNQEITTKSDIELKILPLINSSNISTISASTKVQVKEIINEWCYIQSDVNNGWVRKNTLEDVVSEESKDEKIEEKKEDTTDNEDKKEKQTTTQTTKTGYVNVDTVNLRKEMSTSSAILSNLSKNTEVKVLGEQNNWYSVEVNGVKGYIASRYISDEKVEETVTSRGSDEPRTEKEKTEDVKPVQTTTTTPSATTTTNPNTTASTNTTNTTPKTQTSKEQSTTSTTTTSSNKGLEVVAYAKKYLGCKYVRGGTSPKGFDCSGFTTYVFKHFGISLNRTSSGQRSNGKKVEKSNLQPGDIVCFTGHVGIYIGGNQFIHAANPQKGVIITSLSDSYYARNYITARRVL